MYVAAFVRKYFSYDKSSGPETKVTVKQPSNQPSKQQTIKT